MSFFLIVFGAIAGTVLYRVRRKIRRIMRAYEAVEAVLRDAIEKQERTDRVVQRLLELAQKMSKEFLFVSASREEFAAMFMAAIDTSEDLRNHAGVDYHAVRQFVMRELLPELA